MSLTLVGCAGEKSSASSGSLFQLLHGEVYDTQSNIGVINDQAVVSSLMSAIAYGSAQTDNTLCIVSPMLGDGGYAFTIEVHEKPEILVHVSLTKEDVMGVAVLHHRVVCLIPNASNLEPPEVVLTYQDANFSSNKLKK